MMGKARYWVFPSLWALVIFTLSSFQVHKSSEFDLVDFAIKKTAHVVEYAILFIFVYRAFLNTTSFSRTRSAFLSLILIFLYGVSDEYHQSFTPGREPKVRDAMIDTFGGGLAWIVLWILLPRAPKRLVSLAKTLQII